MKSKKEKVSSNEREKILVKLEAIDKKLSNLGIEEYVNYLESTQKIVWTNLVVGVMRGFGLVLGATVVVAFVTFIMGYLVGLPIIGEWFAWLGTIIGQA